MKCNTSSPTRTTVRAPVISVEELINQLPKYIPPSEDESVPAEGADDGAAPMGRLRREQIIFLPMSFIMTIGFGFEALNVGLDLPRIIGLSLVPILIAFFLGGLIWVVLPSDEIDERHRQIDALSMRYVAVLLVFGNALLYVVVSPISTWDVDVGPALAAVTGLAMFVGQLASLIYSRRGV